MSGLSKKQRLMLDYGLREELLHTGGDTFCYPDRRPLPFERNIAVQKLVKLGYLVVATGGKVRPTDRAVHARHNLLIKTWQEERDRSKLHPKNPRYHRKSADALAALRAYEDANPQFTRFAPKEDHT